MLGILKAVLAVSNNAANCAGSMCQLSAGRSAARELVVVVAAAVTVGFDKHPGTVVVLNLAPDAEGIHANNRQQLLLLFLV